MIGGLLRGVTDAILPPHCLACAQRVATDDTLCGECLADIDFISDPVCGRCGLPLAEPADLCTGCDWDPPRFRTARAALRYGPTTKRLLLPFKYADRPEVARNLARLMLHPGRRLLEHADWLVPVPLHRRRLARAGATIKPPCWRALSEGSAHGPS